MPSTTALTADRPDPDELTRAAMAWHFDPATGSPFWLRRAQSLDFDPRTDITTYADLRRFPNVAAELRDVPVRDLIPRGYGPKPDVLGVYESGGTTGAPKRVVLLHDWLEKLLAWDDTHMDAHGVPRDVDWLAVTPTGPHVVGELIRQSALARGGMALSVDLDPRWVKGLIAAGRKDEAGAYSEHLVEQAAHVLRTQEVAVLVVTPPLLERLAANDELVELINTKVRAIRWGGTQMDQDSYRLYRDEVFPKTVLFGHYGNTLTLGFASQRQGDGPPVFDSFQPWNTFVVLDPKTGQPAAPGERGQVVTTHVSQSFLLPNNVERDLAVRVPAELGDAVSEVGPVTKFEEQDVIEGVY